MFNATLTTSREEYQIPWKQAAGATDHPAIEQVDHVTHCVPRCREGPEVQTSSKLYCVFVWKGTKFTNIISAPSYALNK